MTNLKKEIIENGIHYTLHGDYYFPDLDLPEGSRQSIVNAKMDLSHFG